MATLSSLPNQSPRRHLTAEQVGTDGWIGRCGRQDSAEPPSGAGMLNSRSGSSKKEAARLSGEPSGQVPIGRGSTKQPLQPHNKIWQCSPYACSAYACSAYACSAYAYSVLSRKSELIGHRKEQPREAHAGDQSAREVAKQTKRATAWRARRFELSKLG
jgi:hypothetical protein